MWVTCCLAEATLMASGGGTFSVLDDEAVESWSPLWWPQLQMRHGSLPLHSRYA